MTSVSISIGAPPKSRMQVGKTGQVSRSPTAASGFETEPLQAASKKRSNAREQDMLMGGLGGAIPSGRPDITTAGLGQTRLEARADGIFVVAEDVSVAAFDRTLDAGEPRAPAAAGVSIALAV